MHLFHDLKRLPESKICPSAHVDDWMGLQMGGGVKMSTLRSVQKFNSFGYSFDRNFEKSLRKID